MQITINGDLRNFDSPVTVSQLLTGMAIPDKGIAIAINQNIVPRSLWQENSLKDGDAVLIIRATAGG